MHRASEPELAQAYLYEACLLHTQPFVNNDQRKTPVLALCLTVSVKGEEEEGFRICEPVTEGL